MLALEGITCVTLEQAVAAPLATARLADAGARVIKLERAAGDFARHYDGFARGMSSYFVWLNRGKESCRVDLRAAEDRALVERMIAAADVFVQNLAPGAVERLGLGAETLRRRHPELVVCDVRGFARDSAAAGRKAYDLLIQAETALSAVSGSHKSGPVRVGVSIADIAAGSAAYAGILEALLRRVRTGVGAHVEVSLFDTLAEFMNVPYLTHRHSGGAPAQLGLAHPTIAPYGAFNLADACIIVAVQNEREWPEFCAGVLGDAALASDPRFVDNIARVRNRATCDAAVQEKLGALGWQEATARLDAARIAYGRVSDLADLCAHPALRTFSAATPDGAVELICGRARIDGVRSLRRVVPALGRDDAALRAEFAGSGWAAAGDGPPTGPAGPGPGEAGQDRDG
jgi:crotonobetainyl-CoA:carnitine CoA-transferase CaiB-like acyl-CoA transferase